MGGGDIEREITARRQQSASDFRRERELERLQPGDRASLSRKEPAEHCNHTIESRLKHTQTHTHKQLPQAHPQVSTLREQLAAAAAAMQQDDEYLSSFDPDKPLYQDGWAMGEMQ